jgi:hypothetical protein
VVRGGKTPVLSAEEARKLLDSIETTTLIGLRDRALIGVMVYSFALPTSGPSADDLMRIYEEARGVFGDDLLGPQNRAKFKNPLSVTTTTDTDGKTYHTTRVRRWGLGSSAPAILH